LKSIDELVPDPKKAAEVRQALAIYGLRFLMEDLRDSQFMTKIKLDSEESSTFDSLLNFMREPKKQVNERDLNEDGYNMARLYNKVTSVW